MRKYQKYLLPLSLSLILSFATVIAALRGHGQNGSMASSQRVVDVNEEPIADYLTPEPKDERTRAKKQAKNGRFPKGRLDESLCSSEVIIFGGTWLDRLPAIPVALSDSIIVGTVNDAQAYLSSDKTGLYSEFTFYVEEVLKNNSRTPLNVGSTVAGEREGGACTLSFWLHPSLQISSAECATCRSSLPLVPSLYWSRRSPIHLNSI